MGSALRTEVLVAGSASVLDTLVSVLLERGLSPYPVPVSPSGQEPLLWEPIIDKFDFIFYVSDSKDLHPFLELQRCCRDRGKPLLPGIFMRGIGMVGPYVQPQSSVCWESAWRRLQIPAIHPDEQSQEHAPTTAARNLLVNIMVHTFENCAKSNHTNIHKSVYLLNVETLEGGFHPFLPHPLVGILPSLKWKPLANAAIEKEAGPLEWGELEKMLVGKRLGVLLSLEEDDLEQLPLSLCGVRSSDPLTEGPGRMLPSLICAGMDHGEARHEAALRGIEVYTSRLMTFLSSDKGTDALISAGAGTTASEAIGRAIQAWLQQAFYLKLSNLTAPDIELLPQLEVTDRRCLFYIRSAEILQKDTILIGRSEGICGFPVMWIQSDGLWFGAVGLHGTDALRRALTLALLHLQIGSGRNQEHFTGKRAVALYRQKNAIPPVCPEAEVAYLPKDVTAAVQDLRRCGRMLEAVELDFEPFMEKLKVYGLCFKEG